MGKNLELMGKKKRGRGPGTSEARRSFEPGPPQPIRVILNKETMTVLTYPLDSGHIVIAEFHY